MEARKIADITKIDAQKATIEELGFLKRHYQTKINNLRGDVGDDTKKRTANQSFRRNLNIVKKAISKRQLKLF